MRGVVIDTALGACTVVAFDGARAVAARSEIMQRGHQERLAGLYRELMADTGWAPGDIDRVAVTVGPGSFTGLRVGLAFAEGLGFALDRPVVGLSTLAALAASRDDERGCALTLIDARRAQVYAAAFDGETTIRTPEALTVEAAAALLADLATDGPVAIVGSGAGLVEAPPALADPTPEGLARLAARAEEGAARPLYLRAPDATPPTRRPGEARR